MLKQTLFSSVAGVFVTVLFLATPTAKAACEGYCADRQIENGCERSYAGCTKYYDANDKLYDVDCLYTGDCPPIVQG
jgi:hypothetical protein